MAVARRPSHQGELGRHRHPHHARRLGSNSGLAATKDEVLDVATSTRYSAAVREALDRVRLVSALSSHLEDRAKLMVSGSDVYTMLLGHHGLEARHRELQESRTELIGAANRSKLQENRRQLREVSDAIRQTARDLMEGLGHDAGSPLDTARLRRDRDRLQAVLHHTCGELAVCSFASLRRKVLTLTETRSKLEERDRSAKELSAKIAGLERRLEAEWEDHDAKVREKDETILALRDELRTLREGTVVRRKYKVDTTEARLESASSDWRSRLGDLGREVSRLEARLETDHGVNARTTAFLRRKQDEAAAELRHWEEKYETEYPGLVRELEELTEARDEGAATLAKLRARWEGDERAKCEEAARVAEERREAARRKEMEYVWYIAQCRIRFLWRVFKRRKEARKSKAKGGKKKAGKSKKKKKAGAK